MTRYEPEEMLAEARRQRTEVETMTTALDDAAFSARPEDGGWSVGECLEHLTLLNRIYLDAIDVAAARGREAGRLARPGHRAGRHGRLGDAFVRSLGPPVRMRGKAFRRTVPAQRPRGEVIADFLAAQDRLIGAIDGARDLDLARVRMSSPFFRLLRLSLGQSFGAMLNHNRRHIEQAERVIEGKV